MTYTFNFLFWVLDAIKNFSSKRSKLNNIIFSREVKCMIMLLFKIIWFETSTAAAKMYLLGTTPKLTLHYITIHAMFAQVLIRPGVLTDAYQELSRKTNTLHTIILCND